MNLPPSPLGDRIDERDRRRVALELRFPGVVTIPQREGVGVAHHHDRFPPPILHGLLGEHQMTDRNVLPVAEISGSRNRRLHPRARTTRDPYDPQPETTIDRPCTWKPHGLYCRSRDSPLSGNLEDFGVQVAPNRRHEAFAARIEPAGRDAGRHRGLLGPPTARTLSRIKAAAFVATST